MEPKKMQAFNQNPQAISVCQSRECALLIGLMAGEQEQFYTNSLTTGVAPEQLSHFLSAKSKIKDNSNIQLFANFLKEEGERSAYNIIVSYFLSESEGEKREEKIKNHYLGVGRLVQYCQNLNAFLRYTEQYTSIQITHEDLQQGILAWDLSRLIVLSRIAYDYELISEEEAWNYIEFADKKCRTQFTSWEEIGKSFLLGQVMNCSKEEEFEKAIRYYRLVMENPQSPWIKYPFSYLSRTTT